MNTRRTTDAAKAWLRGEYPWILLVAVFVGLNVIWLKLDRLPPMWDQSWYLEGSELLYRGLVDGGVFGLLKVFTVVNPVKAPLLSVLPVPLYLLFGHGYGVAMAVNLILIAVGSYHLFHMTEALSTRRAAIYAVALLNMFPLVMGLSREFLVETLLAVLVIVWHRYLLRSDLLRSGGPWPLGLILGLGMLTKILFPLYVVGASLYVVWRRVREDRRVTAALAWMVARIVAIGTAVAALWYARNLGGALGAAAGSSFGSVASDYGARSVLAWETLSAYWLRVLEDGISPILTLLLLVAVLSVLYMRATSRDAGQSARPPRTEAGGVVLLWFLVPFLVLTFGVNKDVRFLSPALPALALGGSVALARMAEHPVPRGVGTAGLALALAASVFGSFVGPSATQGLGVVLRSTVSAGAHGPLGSYMRAPSDNAWPLAELLDFVEADALQAGRVRPVAVPLFDHPYLNLNSIGYMRAFDGGNVDYRSAGNLIDGFDTADEVVVPERADYLIVKTGDLGPEFANELNRRVLANVEQRPELSLTLVYEAPLPDGSILTVYRSDAWSEQ